MRTLYLFIIALVLAAASLPVLGAESLESHSKKIQELEKANTVLQDDLSRAQLMISTMRDDVKKLKTDLDAVKKANGEEHTALDQKYGKITDALTTDLATFKDTTNKSIADRFTALDKALTEHTRVNDADFAVVRNDLSDLKTGMTKDLADLKGVHEKDIADLQELMNKQFSGLRESTNDQFAKLKEALDTESNTRTTGDTKNAVDHEQTRKQANRDRIINYALTAILAGFTFSGGK